MSLNFKNRIAFYYMIATAIIMAATFGSVFFIVKQTVINNLDNDLTYEAYKHTDEVRITGDSILFLNKAEWEEKEHLEIQVNPVFIQLIDVKGQVMDKSPNLKNDKLSFNISLLDGHFNSSLNNRAIRQIQIPLFQEGETKGYILAAMSSVSAQTVILKLRNVLIVSYLAILLGLYFISRYLAGRSIRPVKTVTKTIQEIGKENLTRRVKLPLIRDEIYELSHGFNELLDRIENALEREKQFTSDASHELRTPLTAMRGTLEVLIRKERTKEEYEDKIKLSLSEIDRMSSSLDQLLLLARLESKDQAKQNKPISLPTIVNESLVHLNKEILEKELVVSFNFDEDTALLVPHYYSYLILENILSNAVKYSLKSGILDISCKKINQQIVCTIKDEGIGINKKDLKHIYKNFFRSDALQHKQIKGNGLGLSIVKKCVDAIGARIEIESELSKGTQVTIFFK